MEKETGCIKEKVNTDPDLLWPSEPARKQPDLALNVSTYPSTLLTTA